MRPFVVVALVVASTFLTGLNVVFESSSGDGFFESSETRRDLDRRLEAFQKAIIARQKAVDELIAGSRTLPETAARFRQITLIMDLDTIEWLHCAYPDCSDEEAYYRQVLSYAGCRLSFDEENPTLEKLTRELEERRRNGTLVLPDI
jgi:hypothetical protein